MKKIAPSKLRLCAETVLLLTRGGEADPPVARPSGAPGITCPGQSCAA